MNYFIINCMNWLFDAIVWSFNDNKCKKIADKAMNSPKIILITILGYP